MTEASDDLASTSATDTLQTHRSVAAAAIECPADDEEGMLSVALVKKETVYRRDMWFIGSNADGRCFRFGAGSVGLMQEREELNHHRQIQD